MYFSRLWTGPQRWGLHYEKDNLLVRLGKTKPWEFGKPMTSTNDLAIRHALEAAGVEFIDENGGGFGVRLRKLHQAPKRK
jgi:hypothetical protein